MAQKPAPQTVALRRMLTSQQFGEFLRGMNALPLGAVRSIVQGYKNAAAPGPIRNKSLEAAGATLKVAGLTGRVASRAGTVGGATGLAANVATAGLATRALGAATGVATAAAAPLAIVAGFRAVSIPLADLADRIEGEWWPGAGELAGVIRSAASGIDAAISEAEAFLPAFEMTKEAIVGASLMEQPGVFEPDVLAGAFERVQRAEAGRARVRRAGRFALESEAYKNFVNAIMRQGLGLPASKRELEAERALAEGGETLDAIERLKRATEGGD